MEKMVNSENNENNEISEINETNDNKVKTSLLLRIVAILLLLGYLALLGIFIYMVIAGSKYIFAMIFVLIMYPLILYLMTWLRKVFSK